jgi:hypothetical protein
VEFCLHLQIRNGNIIFLYINKFLNTKKLILVKAAIPTGERLIAAEKALEAAFAAGKVDEPSLRRLLAETESARSELRFIHLSQHYKTVQFLKPEQIKRYNVLRGYAEDPCKNIPAGHSPEMYRRHMGCS